MKPAIFFRASPEILLLPSVSVPGYDLVERNVLPFGYRTVDGFHSELLLLRKS